MKKARCLQNRMIIHKSAFKPSKPATAYLVPDLQDVVDRWSKYVYHFNNYSPEAEDWICAEIGVALTSFGALFMLLGVILFFDGALLALGNVRPSSSLKSM